MSVAAKLHVWIHGITGRMGQEITSAVKNEGTYLVWGGSGTNYLNTQVKQSEEVSVENLARALKKVDLIFDFTLPSANQLLMEAIEHSEVQKGTCLLLGTTGLTQKQCSSWKKLVERRELRCLLAPNTSLGILCLSKMAQQMATIFTPMGFDVEIVEAHHRHKKDAPSGTAMFLAESISHAVSGLKVNSQRKGERQPGELGVHALRGGSVFGEHEVRLMGDFEELTISHRALSRHLFAKGAVVLMSWLLQQRSGFYKLEDVSLESIIKLIK